MTAQQSVQENKHMGRGIAVAEDRIALFNQRYAGKSMLDIKDLTDQEGHASGTRVIITLPDLN